MAAERVPRSITNDARPTMADGTSIRASAKESSSGAALQLRLTLLPASGPLLHDAQEARCILEDELRL